MQAEYAIDIALPELRLAIEADGPTHFMKNVPKFTGRTLGQLDSNAMHSYTLILSVWLACGSVWLACRSGVGRFFVYVACMSLPMVRGMCVCLRQTAQHSW